MREKRFKNTDWVVLLITLALLGIGLVALYSSTQNDELFEFKKQIQWAIISVPFLILVYCYILSTNSFIFSLTLLLLC